MEQIIENWVNNAVQGGWTVKLDKENRTPNSTVLVNGDMVAEATTQDVYLWIGGVIHYHVTEENIGILIDWRF